MCKLCTVLVFGYSCRVCNKFAVKRALVVHPIPQCRHRLAAATPYILLMICVYIHNVHARIPSPAHQLYFDTAAACSSAHSHMTRGRLASDKLCPQPRTCHASIIHNRLASILQCGHRGEVVSIYLMACVVAKDTHLYDSSLWSPPDAACSAPLYICYSVCDICACIVCACIYFAWAVYILKIIRVCATSHIVLFFFILNRFITHK